MKYWIGQVTHEDDRDGYELFLVIPDNLLLDQANALIAEARKDDWNIWDVTHLVPRSVFEGLATGIARKDDLCDLGDGYLADLAEPYEVG